MENIKVSISIEENENHFIALQSFPPTATLRQLGLTVSLIDFIKELEWCSIYDIITRSSSYY